MGCVFLGKIEMTNKIEFDSFIWIFWWWKKHHLCLFHLLGVGCLFWGKFTSTQSTWHFSGKTLTRENETFENFRKIINIFRPKTFLKSKHVVPRQDKTKAFSYNRFDISVKMLKLLFTDLFKIYKWNVNIFQENKQEPMIKRNSRIL